MCGRLCDLNATSYRHSLVCSQLLNLGVGNNKKAAVLAANQASNKVAANAAAAKAKNLGVKTLLGVNLANVVNNKDQLGGLLASCPNFSDNNNDISIGL